MGIFLTAVESIACVLCRSEVTDSGINEEYDKGPVFAQQIVEVVKGETAESLKVKVQAIEGELYLQSIKKL